MGLATTHNAFQGAYSSFMRFRSELLEFTEHTDINDLEGYDGQKPYDSLQNRGIARLMNQSDCDGEISPEDCKLIADDLERFIPHMDPDSELNWRSVMFRNGCLEAYSKGETMHFR